MNPNIPPLARAAEINRLALDHLSKDPLRAMELGREALEIVRSCEPDSSSGLVEIATSLRVLSKSYRTAGDFETALKYGLEALCIYEKLGHGPEILDAYFNLMNALMPLGNYEEALEYGQERLHLAREFGKRVEEAFALRDLGMLMASAEDPASAVKFNLESLEIAQKIGNNTLISGLLNNLCIEYLKLEDTENSIKYGEEGRQHDEKTQNPFGLLLVLGHLGHAYTIAGNFERAEELLNRRFELTAEAGNRYLLAYSHFFRAKFHACQNQGDQAIEQYKLAIELGESVKVPTLTLESHQQLARLYESQEMYQEAFQHYRLYNSLREKILDEKNRSRLSSIRIIHETNLNQMRNAFHLEKDRMLKRLTENRQELNRLSALHMAGQQLLKIFTPQELAQEFIEVLENTLDYEYGAVLLLDESGKKLLPFALSKQGQGVNFVDVDRSYLISQDIQVGRGITGWVAKTGQSLLVNDILNDPHYVEVRENIRSELCVPILASNKVIGVLNVETHRLNAYTEIDQRVLETIAAQISIAIQNARLYEQVQVYNRELELQINEREDLIRQLKEKNTELERFTYTVSHDLKSPLVTIKGFLGYVEKDALSGNFERLQDSLGRISSAANKMNRLLNDLLQLSRVGRKTNEPEKVPFQAIVLEALELVTGQLEKSQVKVEIKGMLPVIFADRLAMVEVMQNLIDNALKFMGEQPNPEVEIGSRQEPDRTVLYIKDNGIGIEEKYRDKIFELFEKLDAKTEGTGVGLTLVKRVIEAHAGQIWIESDGAGTGSTFCFTIGLTPNPSS